MNAVMAVTWCTKKHASVSLAGSILELKDTLDIKSDHTNLQITKGMVNSYHILISHHKSCWLHKFSVLFLLQTIISELFSKRMSLTVQCTLTWSHFFQPFFLISKGLLLRLDSSWKSAVCDSLETRLIWFSLAFWS